MANLNGKTLFITGASRGIGKEIALRAARDGANIAIIAKTDTPHPKLPGTIYSAAEEIEQAGGKALALKTDIRDEDQIADAVAQTVAKFGGIDILVNNASAINLTPTLKTPMKRYDLMAQVNTRATFACAQACLPHLLKSDNPHILTMSPPPNMSPQWFANHPAYTMSKYGMSLATFGLAAEFADEGVGVNSLWPVTVIETAALNMIPGLEAGRARKPEILADAAHAILTSPAKQVSGGFFTDECVLEAIGITDLESYNLSPGKEPYPDFFYEPDKNGANDPHVAKLLKVIAQYHNHAPSNA
ncbi:NAD(P)-dependent oxidoreductase [Thalassospira sp. TSL5-1]|uniref:SDR family oxidoreductase n=1 Tax=Thalassospira sp. TSL5-1 TaxID=1544451 RepID=UPI00093E8B6A|nr:NAD(P)-dependent oxidoreductase [Thalassospira sp. TSL5-1]OKH87511.1 short-chain dehydrogenase [Thalassospira sp. TSL5-1]